MILSSTKKQPINSISDCLVIIDIQSCFLATSFVKKEIQKRISDYITSHKGIFLVNYCLDITTFDIENPKWIKKYVKSYDKCYQLWKYKDDASDSINSFVNNSLIDYNTFEICGVNTDACVYSTALGLRRLKYDFVINFECCATDGFISGFNSLENMSSKFKWMGNYTYDYDFNDRKRKIKIV